MFVTGQAKKTVSQTLLECVIQFNKNYPFDCPPEEVSKKLYECNNSLKTRLYNIVAKLKCQASELYFWKIWTQPSFICAFEAKKEQVQAEVTSDGTMATQNGSGDGSHMKNKKQQESGQDLQVGQKLAKEWLVSASEEVRLEIEALALEDAEHKKRMLKEGTPESIQRALQKIELMGLESMKVIKEAGWVCYIHAGGLVPREFYPQTFCLNIGKNEDGLTWGQHHPNYQEHVMDPFTQFLSYPLILADKICQMYQDKMALIHHSNNSDERVKIDQVSMATIAAGLEEGFNSMGWDAGAGRNTKSVIANTIATNTASNGDSFNTVSPSICDRSPPVPEFMMTNSAVAGTASNEDTLDTALATIGDGIPPVEADVADQTTIMTCTPAYHTPLPIDMVNACLMPVANNQLPPTSSLHHLWSIDLFMLVCGGNNMLSEIWDLPSLNFTSIDPGYLQLNLSHVGSSDLRLESPLDIQEAEIDAALHWDAGPGENYLALVDMWKDFEKQTTIAPTSSELNVLQDLLKKKPQAALPVLSKGSQKALIDETLQPTSRYSSILGELPSSDFPEDMGKLKKKDLCGMVQIMYLVRWWGTLVQESDHNPTLWKAFTADIHASFCAMLSAGVKRKMGQVLRSITNVVALTVDTYLSSYVIIDTLIPPHRIKSSSVLSSE
ncbi:hypothetical protein IW262DRAFT_1300593 [Armillaria fumosa]|nr:hypothetical protein IW262DRAFT_1300593 [Armillaria fumosa]